MKTLKDPSQGQLFDPFEGVISEAGWKQIASSWQGLFRHVVLEQLPASRLGQDLSEEMGRPSKELFAMCGLLLIREFHDWTIPEAHEAVLFRSDVQYALNLEPGFDISQRTIERYVARLYADEPLAAELFTTLTERLIEELELSVRKQRLDSTHVASDMAVVGRTRMMGIAVKRFLKRLAKERPDDYELLPEELRTRYAGSSDSQVFGNVRTSEARLKARQQAAEDLYLVVARFSGDETVSTWKLYDQLAQMLSEQCEVREGRVAIKAKTGGAILQNISDPDATYCGNKGPGHKVQLSETCGEENEVELIIAARVETAVQSDADAIEPILEDAEQRGRLPEELLCDSGYGGDDNYQAAQEKGVELISPVPGGAEYDPENRADYQHFTINEAHEATACPAGHAPQSSRYNSGSDRLAITMDYETCRECPLRAQCPVKLHEGPKRNSAKVNMRMAKHRARTRREAEQSEAFRDAYRIRSGIEGTNSCLKRRLGMGRLRVRGRPAVASTLLLKLAGWNILRAATSGKMRKRLAKILEKLIEQGCIAPILRRLTMSFAVQWSLCRLRVAATAIAAILGGALPTPA